MSRSGRRVALALAAGTSWAGCGGESRDASPPGSSREPCPAGCAADGGAGREPVAAPSPTSAAATASTASQPSGPAPTSTAAACVPLDATAAAAASELVAPLGLSRAPAGARPVGSVAAGQCVAGQSLQADLPVVPGGCYTVVGMALAPVQDLDLQLFMPPGSTGVGSAVLAEDETDGLNAVLGAAPNCIQWAWPKAATLKLVVRVEAGQGVVAAQAYEK